ncbi:hypothetical protein DES53_11655 [Roseimicrobium gellanilyticum]|uniref:Uncharacterized protein n=1 Tax=Roseimicrobium gellanilyticum TaxID=748857 RepID=A0A366H417_9BACT|nr:hypothetical protein [Roseimicrobium gellanilyticum]RBP36616.1 hypothetical protein DES53_11655 [Roseimicrobium gellanilyticum]
MKTHLTHGLFVLALPCFTLGLAAADTTNPATPTLKTETFDKDPGWEQHQNLVEIKKAPMVKQDFGYSTTAFASDTAGEIGGSITRTTRPAHYGEKISPCTLGNKLRAPKVVRPLRVRSVR